MQTSLKPQQEIQNLLHVARNSHDAESLWQIVKRLRELSAWEHATAVTRLAWEAEYKRVKAQS